MIVFDLSCAAGHVFEAWFGSSAEWESQRARGLVSCPICGAADVQKAVMAPSVGAKSNRAAPETGGDKPVPATPATMKAALAAMAKAQAKLLEGSEYVGTRFAQEARAIHDGEAPERLIHGQATREEAKQLAEDGVAVMPLPLPVPPPELKH